MSPQLRRTLVFLLCALAFQLGGCAKKDDPVASTQRFFELIKAGKAGAAYASAAFGFKAEQSEKVFAATVKEMGLAKMVSVKSELLETDGRTAKLRTEITGPAGQILPLIVTLTEETGEWRIFSMTTPRSEQTGLIENRFSLVGKTSAFSEALDKPMPGDAEVRRLIKDAMLQFSDAIAANSFDAFYDHISTTWQSQVTKGQIQRAFKPFVDNAVNISGIRDVEPVLDTPAAISTEGLMQVRGHYPMPPRAVFFTLRFIYELPNWKLFGIEVNLRE